MSETTTSKVREADGRFAKGNPGGPGNPYGRQVAELRKAMLSRFTPERIMRMTDKLIEVAERGNLPALRLAYAYGIGLPTKGTDPDRVDIEEWKLYREESACLQDAIPMMQSPGIAGPLSWVRGARPILDEDFFEKMIAELKREPASRGKKRRKARSENRGNHHAAPLPNGDNGAPIAAPDLGLDPGSVSIAGGP